MRILFDQGTPVPLRHALTGHQVETAHEKGWSGLDNGQLLEAAVEKGFEVLLTTDRNLKHQQNLARYEIAVVILTTPSWPRIKQVTDLIARAVDRASPRIAAEVDIP